MSSNPEKLAHANDLERSEEPQPEYSSRTSVWTGYYELTKPRLSFLSVITAIIGYFAAQPGRDLPLFFLFCIGTALSAAGCATINQWLERREDGIMERTRDRPIPTGLVSPAKALIFGILLSVIGTSILWFGVNPLTAYLGAATIISYVAIYTPMKKRTRWNTEVGAISGSLPPLMGWAAAENAIGPLGWILFGILAIWQIPHFMAISWMYRDDYARADFVMLSTIDETGDRVARWSTINAFILFGLSLTPSIFGYTGWFYTAFAAIFGAWLLQRSLAFQQKNQEEERYQAARKLFFNSIFYLPAVLFSLAIDRWILS
ncbi:MAG: heme o synthase [Verrucomicrobiota bacterium]